VCRRGDLRAILRLRTTTVARAGTPDLVFAPLVTPYEKPHNTLPIRGWNAFRIGIESALGLEMGVRLHFSRREISFYWILTFVRDSVSDIPSPGPISTCPNQREFNLIPMHGQSSRIPNDDLPARRSSLQRETIRCARSGNRLALTILYSAMLLLTGCGKTLRNTATEQLILSDSVDRAIRSIDFSPLARRSCYIDTTYLKTVKSSSFVNADYVLSSVRNQLVSAGGILAASKDDADVIVEPRLGVLGANENEVSYGIPSSNLLTQAASMVPTAPPVPTIPEISLARKNDQMAATKLAIFAYDAETGDPVWQSGVSTAQSNAKDMWLFGIGPFQSGTIYEKPRFAGARIKLPLIGDKDGDQRRQAISHDEEFVFNKSPRLMTAPEDAIQHASAETTEKRPAKNATAKNTTAEK
jgi:hypothetical protein